MRDKIRYAGLIAGIISLTMGIDTYFRYANSYAYATSYIFSHFQIIVGCFLIFMFFVPNIKTAIDSYIKNIVKETLKEKK